MRPWCDRCGCARYRTRLNGLGSGSLPLRPILLTRNTKSALPGGFRSLLQNGLSERLGPALQSVVRNPTLEFSEATAYSPNAALIAPRGQRFRIALALRG